MSEALATARPEEICAWVFVRSFCVADRFCNAVMADVLVRRLLIARGIPVLVPV